MNYILTSGILFSLTFIPSLAQSVTTYEYDALNRLVKVTTPKSVTEYTYDYLGNRETKIRRALSTGLQFVGEKSELRLLFAPDRSNIIVVAPPTARGQLLSLLDAAGRTLRRQKLAGEKTVVRTDDLIPGSYVVTVTGSNGTVHNKKFVKR